MTYNEMYNKILEIFPKAQVGQDNEGQLVIYTNCHIYTISDHDGSNKKELIVDMDEVFPNELPD